MTKAKKEKAVVQKRSFWERNEASNGILLKETSKNYAVSIFRAILLFGMCFMILQPILNKISLSFMAEKDLYDSTIIVIPKNFSLNNWKISLDLRGYKEALFNIIIVIPPQTISTSLFLHFRFFKFFGMELNLRSSMIPYILMCCGCMGLKNGLYIFMIRQYFLGFPYELEEAAYVDGCGPFATFFKIMIPGAKPILTSCFLFSFVWQWTDSFYTELFLGKIKLLSTQVNALTDRFGQYLAALYGGGGQAPIGYANAILSTGVLLTIIPLIILYLFAQRLFVESISSTGLKV